MRDLTPLSNDQVQRAAPAVFSEQPFGEVSDRYTFIPTFEILNGLRSEGWYPVQAIQSHARRENGELFAKHMLRLRHSDYNDISEVGDVIPEVILYNSHDAGSSFQLSGGLFRKVCANGLIIADGACSASVRVRHTGDIVNNVIEGAFEVIKDAPKQVEQVREYQGIITDEPERLLLANAASQLRWEEGKAPVRPQQLLVPRRWGDKEPDLWTQFNVIQENLVRGGVRGRNANGNRTTTREVKAPQQNIGLNKALWTLLEGFKELKEAS